MAAEDYAAYVPTEAEIAAACRAIQATWSPAEKERRRVDKPEPWSLPECQPTRQKAAFLYEQSDASVLTNFLPKCEP